MGIVGGGYLGGIRLGILEVVGGRVRVGGEGLLGIGGSVRSAAGCSRRRTWRGTGRVVARSGTPEGDIGPDGAECQRKEGRRNNNNYVDGDHLRDIDIHPQHVI